MLRIWKERRLLRKDLKSKGITKRSDFNAIAQSLGLTYDKILPFLPFFRFLGGNLLRGGMLKTLLAAAGALLVGLFLMSTVTETKGSFTINLTAEMLRAGFVLSGASDFNREETRLISEKMEEVNNITLDDIDPDVDHIDGPHNGRNYIAHTFYIRNKGTETSSYVWYVNLKSETLNVSDAVWIMLFEDGRQVIYSKPTETGEAEELYGFVRAPFSDVAYDYDYQYYEKDGRLGIRTTPYVSEDVVAQGFVEGVAPGETHKYTIVIWIEGYDPECTDDIFGGYAKFDMDFESVSAEEDEDIFAGLYRTEYQDYGLAETE